MFEITPKGRAFIDNECRPRGGCAAWVKAHWNPQGRAQSAPPLSQAA